jgi:hypothetical protein
MASGCGINNKSKHYQNCLMWIMFPTKIHYWRVVIAINFENNFFWRLCQMLNYPLKLKFLNLLGSSTEYDSLLVLKNIIISKGPNMAPWRFCVYSDNQLFHQMNFGVSSYFRFSSIKGDFDLLLFCHRLNNKAFLIHCVKLSSLTNRRYIPTFFLQHFIHLFPHTPWQHSCHLLQTKMVNMYNKDFFKCFFSFEQKNEL